MVRFFESRIIPFFKHKFVHRLLFAILIFGLAISSGIVGFMILEGYTMNEAFFMTIITISTVGYSEIRPLSEHGRLFTSLLIIFNIGAFTYAVSVISAFIFEGDLRSIIKENNMEAEIKHLKKHVIVCGYGRLGKIVCSDLESTGKKVLIVESNKEVIKELAEKGKLFLEGDATDDETITQLGIEQAETLISTFHSDAANVFVALSARELNPEIRIISRASSEANVSKLRLAGANHVIVPEDIGASYIATIASGRDHMPVDFSADPR